MNVKDGILIIENRFKIKKVVFNSEDISIYICVDKKSDDNQLYTVNEYKSDEYKKKAKELCNDLNKKDYADFYDMLTFDAKLYVIFKYHNGVEIRKYIVNNNPNIVQRLNLGEQVIQKANEINEYPPLIRITAMQLKNVVVMNDDTIATNYFLNFDKIINLITDTKYISSAGNVLYELFADTKNCPNQIDAFIVKAAFGKYESLDKLALEYSAIKNEIMDFFKKEDDNKNKVEKSSKASYKQKVKSLLKKENKSSTEDNKKDDNNKKTIKIKKTTKEKPVVENRKKTKMVKRKNIKYPIKTVSLFLALCVLFVVTVKLLDNKFKLISDNSTVEVDTKITDTDNNQMISVEDKSLPETTSPKKEETSKNNDSTPDDKKPKETTKDETTKDNTTDDTNKGRNEVIEYTVKSGEYLRVLSEKFYGVPEYYQIIVDANELDSLELKVGQKLKIPPLVDDNGVPYKLYKVVDGDYLMKISEKLYDDKKLFKVIKSYNDLTDDEEIVPGQILKYPVNPNF